MDSLPFANVTENIMLNDQQKLYKKAQYLYCTNNDMLANIDPDINNLNPNGLTNQCKYYDTSLEFNKTVILNKNISILHANICSSINKLNDFIYYIDNLDTTFNFIGLSETWAINIRYIKLIQIMANIHLMDSLYIYMSLFLLKLINRSSTLIEM